MELTGWPTPSVAERWKYTLPVTPGLLKVADQLSPAPRTMLTTVSVGLEAMRYATPAVATPFVSVIFTPLDNRELAESKQILITALAQDKQTGTEYNADGSQLLKVGTMPLLMEPVQATIRFKGAVPSEVNVLDVYGVPTGRKVKLNADGSFDIDGTYATYYYEVKR